MARALIVGCGCRGRGLGRELLERGWQVRGTTRQESVLEGIEQAGIEAAIADPDRPGTILDRCGDVTVVVWLLGSAAGEPELVAAVHGPRLERLLEKLVDSPVRGFVYETAGTGSGEVLQGGREIVERAAATWRIPVAFLDFEPSAEDWTQRAGDATAGVIAGR